jgi:hypothetical protein
MTEEQSLVGKLAELEARVDALASGRPASAAEDRLTGLLKYLPLLFAANLLIGTPALLISLAIAYATFTQAEATTKIQQAEAWPFVSYGTSNATEDNARVISLGLANDGIGPALLGPIELRVNGTPVRNPKELFERCCGYGQGTGVSFATSPASGISLRPGESVRFLRLTATPANEVLWNRFNDERWKLEVRSCYCSIFDECWVVEGMQSRPQPTRECPTSWTEYNEGTPNLSSGDGIRRQAAQQSAKSGAR